MSQSLTHHTALVNGVRLHYVIGGQGEPLVLLHGFCQTWYEWRHLLPPLMELYTVIAPDLRGLGDSSKPIAGYDKKTIAEDIYQLVQSLGFQEILLAGHDWGAAVACAYALEHPEAVRKLAFLEMALPGFGLEQAAQYSREMNIWHLSFLAAPDIAEGLLTGKERVFFSWMYHHYAYNPTAITPADIDEYLRSYTAPGALRAGCQYYQTLFEDADYFQAKSQTKLTIPVLALGGDRSLGGFALQSMQAVAENVQGGVIPNCGHWVPEERPDYLLDQLLTFFKE